MIYYRTHPLSLSTRMTLAIEMLLPIPERPWGHVTHLSKEYSVSRTWLYELREKASLALSEVLHPRQPGPQPEAETLIIDRTFVQRAIPTLALLKGTVRLLQEGLSLLFGVHRSVGHISETLQQAGQVAAEMNAAVSLSTPVLAEADEIEKGKQPCLTVVLGRSFVLLNLVERAVALPRLKAEQTRDATSWGVTFLDIQKQGISFFLLV